MKTIPDHPAIACALKTGYPPVEDYSVYRCEKCGASIREDEPYYEIGNEIYCPECVEGMKHYA